MSIRLSGRLFQPGQAKFDPAELTRLDEETIVITFEGNADFQQQFPIAKCTISDRIGRIPRRIILPNGLVFETADNAKADSLFASHKKVTLPDIIYNLESYKKYIAVLLVALVAVSFVVVRFGIPAFAKTAANLLPQSALHQSSAEGLALLDRSYFSDSKLSDSEKRRLQGLFAKVMSASGHEASCCALIFRESNFMGANALAMPDGTIVVLDKMVEYAGNDDALAGIFAHEMGHVIGRHSLRQIIQASSLSILVTMLLGDMSQLSELIVSGPLFFTQLQYSRRFEQEADDFAIDTLRAMGTSPRYTGELFAKMDRECQDRKKCGNRWLSTHPMLSERAEKFFRR